MSPPVLYRLGELERKSRGITRANARAAGLERDIASLRARYEAGANTADLEAALNTFEVRLSAHESGTEVRLSALEGGFEEVVNMTTSNKEEVTRAHARITSFEAVVGAPRRADDEPATPFWVWPVAILAGLIAGLWWHLHDWSTLFGQTEVRSPADWWVIAMFVVVGVASVSAGLLLKLASKHQPKGTTPPPVPSAKTEPVPEVERPNRDARV